MTASEQLFNVAIGAKSHRLLHQLLDENPRLHDILTNASDLEGVLHELKSWALSEIEGNPWAVQYYRRETGWRELYYHLQWNEIAAIRILDYIDNTGRCFENQNIGNEITNSHPFEILYMASSRGTGGARPDYFTDMIELFRQFTGRSHRTIPDRNLLETWMERHLSGLDPRVIAMRKDNRERIIHVIIDLIDCGEKKDSRYFFTHEKDRSAKFRTVEKWWRESLFHLRFAARTPQTLNRMLGDSLSLEKLEVLEKAKAAGIPFFVNPHYVSLLNVRAPAFAIASDLAIRDYVLYSSQLVEAFGSIVAWEKEDKIEDGKPNAAGWLLPTGANVHRRYPDSAILIPNTKGRACGGLCTACQRMYNFQKGRQNFDFEALSPQKGWRAKLQELMAYFENDSYLRDILITGGDAFMSTDKSLKRILDAVYDMAVRKREKNRDRADGDKYAEMTRVRLATRLLSYLPQRVTPALSEILLEFKLKASQIGISQFHIQTHFESAMEFTPETRDAIRMLQNAGWVIVNQHVFTTASSRRGHTARLRQVMAEQGVIPYYTFSVKGFKENHQLFSTASRIMQEMQEEKCFGAIPEQFVDRMSDIRERPGDAPAIIQAVMREAGIPFPATDRNISNLPALGKSLSFRVIGITRHGERILEFEYDDSRKHSPIIRQKDPCVFIESKSIAEYLHQIEEMGDDSSEYTDLYGYSIGITEPRFPLFEYPDFGFDTTRTMTNLSLTE